MNYKIGDVVVVRFPFVLEGGVESYKGRPALVISNQNIKRRYDDLTLAAITTHVPDSLMRLEILLETSAKNGLKKNSLLRLDYIMTIPANLVSRKIGTIDSHLIDKYKFRLKLYFEIDDYFNEG